jgi:hypothetical protein
MQYIGTLSPVGKRRVIFEKVFSKKAKNRKVKSRNDLCFQ